jgi:hypothetical protein
MHATLRPPCPDFELVGINRSERFEIADQWRRRGGVYLWVHRDGADPVVRRVGIACGRGGFGARFSSYDRWLAGVGKFGLDPREVEVARLTRLGLKRSAELWGRPAQTRQQSKMLEQELRAQFAGNLSLDLAAPKSWIERKMIDWRHLRRAK